MKVIPYRPHLSSFCDREHHLLCRQISRVVKQYVFAIVVQHSPRLVPRIVVLKVVFDYAQILTPFIVIKIRGFALGSVAATCPSRLRGPSNPAFPEFCNTDGI